jgi:DNA-binding protein H-NS
VAAKYRDPVSGSTWSGRGIQPKWMKSALAEGKNKDDFLIA